MKHHLFYLISFALIFPSEAQRLCLSYSAIYPGKTVNIGVSFQRGKTFTGSLGFNYLFNSPDYIHANKELHELDENVIFKNSAYNPKFIQRFGIFGTFGFKVPLRILNSGFIMQHGFWFQYNSALMRSNYFYFRKFLPNQNWEGIVITPDQIRLYFLGINYGMNLQYPVSEKVQFLIGAGIGPEWVFYRTHSPFDRPVRRHLGMGNNLTIGLSYNLFKR